MSKKEKLAIASDHAGLALKESLKKYLVERGLDVVDLGTNSTDSVDYPDYAQLVASGVSSGRFDRGVLVCATGLGMSMAANRFPNVRAALVTSNFQAEMAAKHNKANVLIFGAKVTSPTEARGMLKIWMDTPYEGGRHDRRIDKIDKFRK